MKVLILSVSDKRHMPMIAPFIDYLEKNAIQYDIIRSNRYETQKGDLMMTSHRLGKTYEVNMTMDISKSRKIDKLIPFLKFRRIAKKIIRKEKYNYIIAWNENTIALFADILSFKYAGNCCLNIRDVYQEQFLLSILIDFAIKRCHFATAPSPEFKAKHQEKFICLYNRDTRILEQWSFRSSFREIEKPIRIVHLGFYSKVKKGADELAELFGNDSRFELFFIGKGFETEYKSFVEDKGYRNIHVEGAFPYEDTIKYLQQADIINSYYNMFNQASLRISFGIKHSYTPMLHLPGLADEDTCWGRMSKPYGLAYLVNNNNISTLPDDLYDWYRNLDFAEFNRQCDEFNRLIDETQLKLIEELKNRVRK